MLAVRRVREGIHVEEVPLLFEYIRLGLPFPHEQLPKLFRAEREPAGSTSRWSEAGTLGALRGGLDDCPRAWMG